MALNSNYSKQIAEGFSLGKTISCPTPYLGLLTTMPAADGTGSVEVSYPEYSRVKINVAGIEGSIIMGDATIEASTDDADKNIAVVKNQEIIYFPEAETAAGGTAVGFAFFSAKTGGTPYLWGELKAETTINQNSVPMFRISDFALRVK